MFTEEDVSDSTQETPDNTGVKELVVSALNSQHQHSQAIAEYYKKVKKTGNFIFRFPFILKNSDIPMFDKIIQERQLLMAIEWLNH